MIQRSQEVELSISISDEDTTFITFDGGGTAKVESIDDDAITVSGDDPPPSPLERYMEPTEESYSWKAVLPIADKGVWQPFINSIQVYNR